MKNLVIQASITQAGTQSMNLDTIQVDQVDMESIRDALDGLDFDYDDSDPQTAEEELKSAFHDTVHSKLISTLPVPTDRYRWAVEINRSEPVGPFWEWDTSSLYAHPRLDFNVLEVEGQGSAGSEFRHLVVRVSAPES